MLWQMSIVLFSKVEWEKHNVSGMASPTNEAIYNAKMNPVVCNDYQSKIL